MQRKRLAIVAAAAAVAVCTGLGVGVGLAAGPSPTAATPLTVAEKVAGAAAFKKAGCATCHMLAAARAAGTRGPNLDLLYFPIADMLRQVTNGSSYMPSFKGILTPAQIGAVVRYVDALRAIKAPGSTPAATTTTKAPATTTTAAPVAVKLTAAQKATGILAFNKASCATCHTLSARGATGTRGPNLDLLFYPVADIVRQVTNGGGYMPSFDGILTRAQIQAVANYIASVRLIKG